MEVVTSGQIWGGFRWTEPVGFADDLDCAEGGPDWRPGSPVHFWLGQSGKWWLFAVNGGYGLGPVPGRAGKRR